MTESPDLLILAPFVEHQLEIFVRAVAKAKEINKPAPDEGEELNVFFDKILETMTTELNTFASLSPKIQEEANDFAVRVMLAKLPDLLEELDKELARREEIFRQTLTRHRWYMRQLNRFILRKAQSEDYDFSLFRHRDGLLFEKEAQKKGQLGFLTAESKPPVRDYTFEQTLAKIRKTNTKFFFKESKSLSWKLYAKYRVRYPLSFAKHCAREAVVSFFICVLLVEWVIQDQHIEYFGYIALILAFAYIAEKLAKKFWLSELYAKAHGTDLFMATGSLYTDYLQFARALGMAEVATVSIFTPSPSLSADEPSKV